MNLIEVLFSPSLRTLEKEVFSQCKTLKVVTFAEGLESIGEKCFQQTGLSGRASNECPRTQKSAFLECKYLTRVILPPRLQSIRRACFSETALEELVVPGSVVTLGAMVCFKCARLARVMFQEGLKGIGKLCFESIGIKNYFEEC